MAKRVNRLAKNANNHFNKQNLFFGSNEINISKKKALEIEINQKKEIISNLISSVRLLSLNEPIKTILEKFDLENNQKCINIEIVNQLRDELRQIKNYQINLWSHQYQKRKKKTIFYRKLFSTMHFHFFLREKLILLSIKQDSKFKIPFEILESIFNKNFKRKSYEKNSFIQNINQEDFALISYEIFKSTFYQFQFTSNFLFAQRGFDQIYWNSFLLHYGKNIENKIEQNTILNIFNSSQLNDLYEEAVCLPLFKRKFNFSYLTLLLKQMSPYFSYSNWGYKSEIYFQTKNKRKIIQFYYEILEKFEYFLCIDKRDSIFQIFIGDYEVY